MMRSAATEMVNFFVGDSLEGIRLNRNMLGGYQRIRNSTIIGETINLGAAGEVTEYSGLGFNGAQILRTSCRFYAAALDQ